MADKNAPDEVLLTEIRVEFGSLLLEAIKYADVEHTFDLAVRANKILAKAREAVKGASLKLNRGGILSDVEVEYYNNGAEAQIQAILKALGGE